MLRKNVITPNGVKRPIAEVDALVLQFELAQYEAWKQRIQKNIPPGEWEDLEGWKQSTDPYGDSLQLWIARALVVIALERGHGDPREIVDQIINKASVKGILL